MVHISRKKVKMSGRHTKQEKPKTSKKKVFLIVFVVLCVCAAINSCINPSGPESKPPSSAGQKTTSQVTAVDTDTTPTDSAATPATPAISSLLGDKAEIRNLVKDGNIVASYAYAEATSADVTLSAVADYYSWWKQKSQESQLDYAMVVYTDKTSASGEKMGAYVGPTIMVDVTFHTDEPVGGVDNYSLASDGRAYFMGDDGSLVLSASLYDGSSFDPTAYRLTVEINDVTNLQPGYIIVSVYGYGDYDFPTMRQAVEDAANAYGVSASAVTATFDAMIGTEGSSGDFKIAGWSIITSAPNEYEDYYRADLYLLRN